MYSLDPFLKEIVEKASENWYHKKTTGFYSLGGTYAIDPKTEYISSGKVKKSCLYCNETYTKLQMKYPTVPMLAMGVAGPNNNSHMGNESFV